MLRQIEFLKEHSLAHQVAEYNAKQVADMVDGETPKVISDNFVDVPQAEDIEEDDAVNKDNSKYRGPADATVGARESGEDRESARRISMARQRALGQEHLLASGGG